MYYIRRRPTMAFRRKTFFLLADDFNTVVGQGHLVRTHHPYLFPERPINIFLSISTRGPGREMLLGALLARAIQLHQQTPYLKARVFAQVGMDDAPMLSLYMDSGFEADDALDIIKIQMPPAKPSAPLGYDMGFIPLQSSMEQASFLMRMNMYRLDLLTQPILRQYMGMQHFIALYIARGSEIVGEIAMTGQGDTAQVIGPIRIAELPQAGARQNADRGIDERAQGTRRDHLPGRRHPPQRGAVRAGAKLPGDLCTHGVPVPRHQLRLKASPHRGPRHSLSSIC